VAIKGAGLSAQAAATTEGGVYHPCSGLRFNVDGLSGTAVVAFRVIALSACFLMELSRKGISDKADP